MEYDLVIGNPPYMRDLHLKILDEVYKHVKEGGEIVWLAPVVRLASHKNIYDETAIKKFYQYDYIWKNITKFAEFTEGEMFKIFQAKPQNKVGIFHVVKNTKNSNDISPDKFINLSDKLKNKIKNIMNSGNILKLSTGLMLSPNEEIFNKVGIKPDYIMPMDYKSSTDTQLDKAIEILNS